MKNKHTVSKIIYLITSILLSGFLTTGFAMELPLLQDSVSMDKGSEVKGDYDEEVYVDDLPESVKASLDEAYNGFELFRAYKNIEGNYKIEIENGNEKAVVYYDMNGMFLKAEDNNNVSTMEDM